MGLMSNDEAVPSRIIAIIKMLREPLTEEKLVAAISPASLMEKQAEPAQSEGLALPGAIRERTMVPKCRSSAVAAGLVEIDGNELSSPLACDADLCGAITTTLLGKKRDQNRDVLEPLAWWLLQDPAFTSPTLEWVLDKIDAQIGGERLGIKKTEDARLWLAWARYLGFAAPLGKEIWVPDPTAYLARFLPQLLPVSDGTIPLVEFLRRIRQACPIWPGGAISLVIEPRVPVLSDGRLRWSESVSLLRLHERREVTLDYRADGHALRFNDGDESILYTSIGRGAA